MAVNLEIKTFHIASTNTTLVTVWESNLDFWTISKIWCVRVEKKSDVAIFICNCSPAKSCVNNIYTSNLCISNLKCYNTVKCFSSIQDTTMFRLLTNSMPLLLANSSWTRMLQSSLGTKAPCGWWGWHKKQIHGSRSFRESNVPGPARTFTQSSQ